MNIKILALALGLVLTWVASEATAQDIGECNSIAAGAAGAVGQINQAIDVAGNCGDLLTVVGEFVAAGCDQLPPGTLFVDKIRAHALENVCNAAETCGIPLNICL